MFRRAPCRQVKNIDEIFDCNRLAFLTFCRFGYRRYSDGYDIKRRIDPSSYRKPKSWQPSPYDSDEDDELLSREEKKAKIKAEISRRRQQIEENARLHDELLRLARLRENAEMGYEPHSADSNSTYNTLGLENVLKSIDDYLQGDTRKYNYYYDTKNRSLKRTPEDKSMDRIASTFRTDDYTGRVYERMAEFSPMTDLAPPMPLLPDMPTRSRRILEDLGSSPINDTYSQVRKSNHYR